MTTTPIPAPGAGTSPDQSSALDAAARLQAVHDRLLLAVQELTSADGWQQMLRTAAALPTYSPQNVLLITSQCRHATAVQGFHAWKQLGRSVKKGEKGIAILAPIVRRRHASNEPSAGPMTREQGQSSTAPEATEPATAQATTARRVTGFRVVHVFDISQTDGPDLPAPPRPVLLDGHAPTGLIDGLTTQVQQHGYQLLWHTFDIPHPGQGSPNGVTDFFAKTVLVRPDLPEAQTAKTLAHELGHVLLHEPSRRPASLSREQAEVEAESVAYVVTAAHGLDSSTYTVPYVAGWAGTDLTLVARTAERVLSTARDVLQHTPPPAAHALPENTREQLRSRDRTTNRSVEPPERTRESAPAIALAERSRLTRTGQLSRTDTPIASAPSTGRRDRDEQGRL